jgi:SAM-dependent methyltransferase
VVAVAVLPMVQIKNLNNLLSFNAWSQRYVRNDLLFPERELLIILRDNLKDMDVLDLGVGAGRTSFTLTALARTYIGIDYAPGMVTTCRSRFGESDRQKFMCLDAADLSKLDNKKFDLVLFSFNGMDCVDLERRHKILHEVHRLLKSDGHFFFSGLSLDALPWPMEWPRFQLTRPFRSMVALARKAIWNGRLVLANWGQNIDELKKRGWAYLQDGSHNFGLILFYATRSYQIRELRDHGFEIELCFGLDGRKLGVTEIVPDRSIHFLCRKASEAPTS